LISVKKFEIFRLGEAALEEHDRYYAWQPIVQTAFLSTIVIFGATIPSTVRIRGAELWKHISSIT